MKRGPYKKRRLLLGLQQLAESLIREARHIGGFTYEQLNELLDLDGECQRYAACPDAARKRAPKAEEIQHLENQIASILKRPARKIVVVDIRSQATLGVPSKAADYLAYSPEDLSLAYADGPPLYEQMIDEMSDGDEQWADYVFATHAWQWGILWERNIPELSRSELGVPDDVPVDELICILQGARRRAVHDYDMHLDSHGWSYSAGQWADLAWRRLNFLAPRCAAPSGSHKPARDLTDGFWQPMDLPVLD
jgi:hypothetical protein